MKIRPVRLLVPAALTVMIVVLGATATGAHVTVVPDEAPKGGFEILSFSVPNEEEAANTVGLEVTVPTKNPIASVSTKPMPGWTVSVEKTGSGKPAVSKITWTATDGGLEPGEFDLFTISAGPLPTKAGKLTFKAIQTYSDGTTVDWIQATVKGAPEPEHPAPVLTLTKASGDHH
jgi:periplasmic copper chaperone A